MSKKAVLVLAEQVFRDEEYFEPKEVLEGAGVEVLTASTTTGEVLGKLGARVKPDLLISELNLEEIDLLVFVGGGGAQQYFDDPVAHAGARKMVESGKLLGAICIAPVILARAGVLKGKKATVFIDGVDELRENGAIYTGNQVEVDGKIITANGPEAARLFGEELVRQLQLN
ncbi:MAG TPA: DJ-1/PfpI family protein [Bacillota bacterium]